MFTILFCEMQNSFIWSKPLFSPSPKKVEYFNNSLLLCCKERNFTQAVSQNC